MTIIKEYHIHNSNPTTQETEESPVYIEEITKRYKRKTDAINYFFSKRKNRDFCYGNNYVHTEDTLTIYEYDEDGYSEYILFKWNDFDEEVVFTYYLKEGDDEYQMNYKELYDYCKKKNSFVYWEDDTYGHYGHLKEKWGKSLDIYVKCNISTLEGIY